MTVFPDIMAEFLLLLLLISTPLLRIRSLRHFLPDLIAKEMIYLRIDLVFLDCEGVAKSRESQTYRKYESIVGISQLKNCDAC